MTERTDTTGGEQSLLARYGEPKRTPRRLGIVAIALVALTLLGWLVWAAWSNGHPAVSAQVHSYDVVSPHVVNVTVDYSTASAPAQCVISAQAVDHSVVGQRVVRLPGGVSEQTLSTSIRTNREATTATVGDCHQR